MTLPELMLTIALFSILLTVAAAFLNEGVSLWKNVSGTDAAALEIRTAHRYLEGDLLFTSNSKLSVDQVPASLPGGGFDGNALWFLSMTDPASGTSVRQDDGTPYWQRNVLYYLVVPSGHTGCQGGQDAEGYDDRCPHKVLIRKVIDSGAITTPTGDPLTDIETLLPDVIPYLTRPNGMDVTAMKAEAGVEQVEIVANKLLSFRALRSPDPRFPRELELTLKAVSLADARNKVRLGIDPMGSSPYTVVGMFDIVPRN